MSSTTSQGTMLEYISNIEFSLNFEDSKNSVKVRIGDLVKYDGTFAVYLKTSGDEVRGRTPSLRSAIASKWLTLKGNEEEKPDNVKAEQYRNDDQTQAIKGKDYDPVRGGNFDKFVQSNNEIVSTSNVVQEKDRVVKKFSTINDQVSVSGSQSTSVTSSTSPIKGVKAHSTKVVDAEHYNATSSTPLKFKSASTSSLSDSKSYTFTVDENTPRVSEEASLKEINRITKPVVVEAPDSQDAVVIKKVKTAKALTEEIDGITLKGSSGAEEKEIDFSTKVTSGGSDVADLSGVSTQEQVAEIESPKVASEPKADLDAKYASMLPEGWDKLHWVKKEQFIKELTDRDFIKYILINTPVKAVQNACRKRLVEIEKLAMQN